MQVPGPWAGWQCSISLGRHLQRCLCCPIMGTKRLLLQLHSFSITQDRKIDLSPASPLQNSPISGSSLEDRQRWLGEVVGGSKSFLEALPAFLGQETAELISQDWIGLERIHSSLQKTPRKLGKGMTHWGALVVDMGLSDWGGVSDDISEQLIWLAGGLLEAGQTSLPERNLVIPPAPHPDSHRELPTRTSDMHGGNNFLSQKPH